MTEPNSLSPDKLNISLSLQAQAKLRLVVAVLIIVSGLIGLPDVGAHPWVAIVAVTHIFYALLLVLIARKIRPSSLKIFANSSAVLDPLLLTAWLPLVGEYGGLIVGFYLFTVLGFGFRIGQRQMHIAQVASVLGFATVLLVVPFWRQHLIVWFSFQVTLIIVPLYATILLKKLHEARLDAENKSQAKSQLLARVSHELRTPLSGIMAATQLLVAETNDAKVAQRSETIMNLSNDLLREITDLLDQSKYEAHALALESSPFNLADLLERVRLTLEPAARKKGISFHGSVDSRILERVKGDAHYLSRVLINLAGNAVKFTDSGGVDVRIEFIAESELDYQIRFSVRDTGIGIEPAFHKKIFDPFFQGDQSVTRRFGGTGLGMTIANELVELMGGQLCFESQLGHGSYFYFVLSLPRVALEKEKREEAAQSVVYGKRIFVSDDNETNLILIKELLEIDQHEVIIASSGMDSLEILSKQDFDVLFLDFNMGDMDGAKLLQIYRFGKAMPAPAFFLTADATTVTLSKLKNSGALGVLLKPIKRSELRNAVIQACEQAGDPVSVPTPEMRTTAVPVIPSYSKLTRPNSLTETSAEQATPPRPILKAIPSQLIDMTVIQGLKSVSARPQFLKELLVHAEGDISRNVDALIHALTNKDFNLIRDSAHALKSVCVNVGATRLALLATLLMHVTHEQQGLTEAHTRAEIIEASRASLIAIREIISNLEGGNLAGPLAVFLH